MYYHFLLLGCFSLAPVRGASQPSCELRKGFNIPGLTKDGDIIVGGIFHFHFDTTPPLEAHSFTAEPPSPTCESFDLKEFRLAQTMIFAIEEINNNTKLLPNLTLGYKIYDGCRSETLSVKAVMALISLQDEDLSESTCESSLRIPALLADAGFISTLAETLLTGPFAIPTISFSARCQCFSDREFPTLFEIVPDDSHQIRAITLLVKYFGWNWIGLFQSNSTYIAMETETIIQNFREAGICIAYKLVFSKTDSREKIREIIRMIEQASTKIVISFARPAEMEVLLREVVHQNVTGIQWIGSESWITIPILTPKENARFLRGAMGFVVPDGRVPGLKEFLLQVNPFHSPGNTLMDEFWERTFRCTMAKQQDKINEKSVQQCTGEEHLQDITNPYTETSQLRISYRVYNAMYAVARAIHNTLSCGEDRCTNMSDFESQKLLYYLKTLSSINVNGNSTQSHHDNDWVPKYELINWQVRASDIADVVSVGKYDGSATFENMLEIDDQAIVWSSGKAPQGLCVDSCSPGTRKGLRPGQPVCCFDCVPCHDGDISNVTDALFCTKCPLEYWPNELRTECLPKEIEFLSFDDGLGATLAGFTIGGVCLTIATTVVFYNYRHTPLVRANNSELSFIILFSIGLCFLCALTFIAVPSHWSCILRFTVFGVTFAMCLAGILGKTMVVLMAFSARHPQRQAMRWFTPSQQRIGVLILTLIQFTICILWVFDSPPYPFKNPSYYAHILSLECKVGSDTYFWGIFIVIFLLTAVTLVLAFFTRKLPNSYNEAAHITFSLLTFCVVWATFFPVYASAPEKYAASVHAFTILASSFSLLLCIFAPKCYIILFKPHLNSRKLLLTFSSS
ncbi:extracellular calcium-sensing receptor-like [Mobula birostris]|uniref:extracellular calcium-sensing receptor-like n=1 Tax=Mobula birostris TaxID=1983395 RepID=UPI003B28996C